MATLLLGQGSAALGASAALSSQLGLIGSLLDSQFILPALRGGLGGGRTSVPSFGDQQISTASEGSPLPIVTGRARVPGHVIWARPLFSEPFDVSGGKQGEIISKRWFTDVAVAFARNEVEQIRRIWADGELIYNDAGTIDGVIFWDANNHLTNFQITEWAVSIPTGGSNPPQRPGVFRTLSHMDIVGEDPANLSQFLLNQGLTVNYDPPSGSPLVNHTVIPVSRTTAVSGVTTLRVNLDQLMNPSPNVLVPFPQGRSSWFKTPVPRVEISQVSGLGINVGTRIFLRAPHGQNGSFKFATDFLLGFLGAPHLFGGRVAGFPGPANGALWTGIPVDSTSFDIADTVGWAGTGASWNGGIDGNFIGHGAPHYVYFPPLDPLSTTVVAPGRPITFQQGPQKWKVGPTGGLIVDESESTIYLGTDTQTADPVIQGQEGVTSVPAFRGTAYAVLKHLHVGDFGNRIPNFMAEVVESSTPTIKGAVDVILDRYRVDPSKVDTSALSTSTVPFRGFVTQGVQSAAQALAPLMLANDFLLQTDKGKVKFLPLDENAVTITVPEGDLAAREGTSGQPPPPLRFLDTDEREIPKNLWISFFDDDNDQQRALEPAFRNQVLNRSEETVDLGVSLRRFEARDVARRIQRRIRAGRQRVALTLPPKYLHIQESDQISTTAFGKSWRILVTKANRGANLIMALEGVVLPEGDFATLPESSSAESVGDLGGMSSVNKSVETLVPILAHVIDIAPFSDLHMQTPGMYFAVGRWSTTGASTDWTLYEAAHGSTSYRAVGGGSSFAVTGRTDPTGPSTLQTVSGITWDRLSTVDVLLDSSSDQLASVTDAEARGGRNRCLIGNEVVTFTTATLLAAGKYRLSGFIRGQLGTEGEIGLHIAEDRERFVMLDVDNLLFHPLDNSARGTERQYKVVQRGQILDDAVSLGFSLVAAQSNVPAPPGQFEGFRDNTDELTFKWRRRTRSSYRVFSSSSAPNLEGDEVYKVTFKDSNGDTLRTKTVTDATTVDYTTSEQSADGLTLGDPVTATVQKVSTVSGDGRPSLPITV